LVANSTFSLTPPFKACLHACAPTIKLAKTKNKERKKEKKQVEGEEEEKEN
jgi:hypothetical protein